MLQVPEQPYSPPKEEREVPVKKSQPRKKRQASRPAARGGQRTISTQTLSLPDGCSLDRLLGHGDRVLPVSTRRFKGIHNYEPIRQAFREGGRRNRSTSPFPLFKLRELYGEEVALQTYELPCKDRVEKRRGGGERRREEEGRRRGQGDLVSSSSSSSSSSIFTSPSLQRPSSQEPKRLLEEVKLRIQAMARKMDGEGVVEEGRRERVKEEEQQQEQEEEEQQEQQERPRTKRKLPLARLRLADKEDILLFRDNLRMCRRIRESRNGSMGGLAKVIVESERRIMGKVMQEVTQEMDWVVHQVVMSAVEEV